MVQCNDAAFAGMTCPNPNGCVGGKCVRRQEYFGSLPSYLPCPRCGALTDVPWQPDILGPLCFRCAATPRPNWFARARIEYERRDYRAAQAAALIAIMEMARPAPQHLICTRPKNAVCTKCARPVLYAVVHGEHTRMDPIHLSLRGEAMVLLSGASTYQTGDTRDDATRLRTAEMITRGLPAGAYIHPGHRCGADFNHDGYTDDRTPTLPLHYSGAAPPF